MIPDWLQQLVLPAENPGTSASLLIVFLVMATGIALGKIRFRKISLGIAGVLFTGILAGHFGYRIDLKTLDFLRDAGLILFVYAVGMQVGPSFFSSFKKDGLLFNTLAIGTILSGALTTILLYKFTSTGMDNMVGIMSGAVTNTPGLGAAKAALHDVAIKRPDLVLHDPANAYAITYPFGVLGVILLMLAAKSLFKIDIKNEIDRFEKGIKINYPTPGSGKCRVTSPMFIGKAIEFFLEQSRLPVIISRLKHSGSTIVESPSGSTLLKERDVLMLVGLPDDVNKAIDMLGYRSSDLFIESQEKTLTKSFLVTHNNAVQKSIEQLNLEDNYGARITRVYRSGLELLATPSLVLHYGDKVRVVGDQLSLEKIAKLLGNSEKRLTEPQLLSIFLGVVLGIGIGSIPLLLPGLSAPVKLGLAAGPLLVALVISRYGGIATIHSFLNQSAMLFMKDFGICLFFAAVGLHAGESFYKTFVTFNGGIWVLYGICITVIPLLLLVLVARLIFRMNYLPLLGLIAGTYTDPAALAFSASYFKSDLPTQAYATVYPMATIMRILVAQLLVLYFTG
ncbi:MAG: putative transporter [Chitinophagales bacterium]|nr:putative transporter [Chitinophagaceae bacterium]MBP9884300.1 putative transporter [Chitinophagales bacterium]